VLAQRLVRVICEKCKEPLPADQQKRIRAQFSDKIGDNELYHGKGCRACNNIGYRGRQGVFEMMAVTDEVRSLILNRSPSHVIRKAAVKDGMNSLRDDGWRQVRAGRTTVDELMQNTKDEEHGFTFTEGAH